ncbi:MAG: DNA polymerase III subunit alpha [Flavobacteriales bacterium]|nr:DNA polymerase III subunit alpha [Flavobacteriales bacterium]
MPQFCHTHFSLCYGILSPDELLAEAQQWGITRLVVTDINNTSACHDLLRLAPKYGIDLSLGVDFRNGAERLFVAVARNNEGFREMNAYLSQFLTTEKKQIPWRAPAFRDVVVIYPFRKDISPDRSPEERGNSGGASSNFGAESESAAPLPPEVEKGAGERLRINEFIGIAPFDLRQLPFSPWRNHPEKLVALTTVTVRNRTDFNLHRLLRAIDNNALLSHLPKSEEGSEEDVFRMEEKLQSIYAGFPEILNNTERVLADCRVAFEPLDQHGHRNQRSYTGNSDLDFRLLRRLCLDGIAYRYGSIPSAEVADRLEREMLTIRDKGFVSYFLISWKIVKYANSRGYFHVGRGSGANSIVSYLIGITDVDPIHLNLYFERFINLFRKSPPDFDIDFSWRDREDVTRYIFERFPHVALCGAYVTFQAKSVIRELGKVFGLPNEDIVRLQQTRTAEDRIGRLVLRYAELLHDRPSHLSPHSAGILISDKDIHSYTATFLPPKGFPTVHFDMVVAEDIGLFKWDILGQRGLAKIKDALGIIRENRGEEVDIHDVKRFYEDGRCNALLAAGNAIGCFYIESPAMRMLLTKLRVGDYLGLVAASSVIRPGVAQSGMMNQYIIRHRNPEKRKEAHPILLELMPETYGVMVYQEDVIKVAHHFAGLSPSEADILRRGMSGKFRNRAEFDQVQVKFMDNCRELGRDEAMACDVWRQMESFAGYAFAKGHSASYAVESYQCLFLKAYFPLEYMTATVNNGGGFYSRQIYLHEARKHGATLELPCINRCQIGAILQGKDIFIGLGFINGLREKTMNALLRERAQNGPFADLRDAVERTAIHLEQWILLIRAGALRFSGKNKKELLWDVHFLLGHAPEQDANAQLFRTAPKSFQLPELWHHPLESAFDEMELFGFAVTSSPFDMIDRTGLPTMTVRQMSGMVGKNVEILGYRVHVKSTATKQHEKMHFGTLIDLDGEWIDTVHFPQTAARYPFRGPGCYLLRGKVTEEFGHLGLTVGWLRRVGSLNLDSTAQ